MATLIDKLRKLYYKIIPYDYRPHNLYYQFICWIWYRYRSVKPRTLPGQTWIDRDKLLEHTSFEILSQFMEKELKGYRSEDWSYYYADCVSDLVDFGGSKKDPYYVLDYLYRWWKFYNEKKERLGESWDKLREQHCKSSFDKIDDSNFLALNYNWDTPENEKIADLIFKRYMKKENKFYEELTENLILLIRLRRFMWT